MDQSVVSQYLRDFQERSLPELTDRELEVADTDKILTIYGSRRSGKTFYLFQIMKELMENGVDKNRILYLNFEDTKLSDLDYKDIEEILKLHWEIYPDTSDGEMHIFLDEIQTVENWEKAVRTLHDRGFENIYVTGSSATLLSKEIATELRGRTLSYLMLSYSFREFLKQKGFPVENYPQLSSREEARIKNLLEEYLEWGGFPEVVKEENENVKTQILQEYRQLTLYKDLVERHNVKNEKVLDTLFKHLYSSFSAPFSPHNFYNTLKSQGIKVGKETVYNYTHYMEETVGVFMLDRWHPSAKTREMSQKKAYLPDTGFGNLYTAFSDKKSQLLENMVFMHLKRRQNTYPGEEIYCWKNDTQEELDFLLKQKDEVKSLIQVSHSMENDQIRERELRALKKANKSLECSDLRIITWDTEQELQANGETVQVTPVWKWMMENNL
ncbi:MAG: AAA family ATPase [Nanohaloarchaea archaeon SW_7_43_1]|nr:MAG: AAA family ATPase [Nanohaloarchaea archaeon SW_7_43_1]